MIIIRKFTIASSKNHNWLIHISNQTLCIRWCMFILLLGPSAVWKDISMVLWYERPRRWWWWGDDEGEENWLPWWIWCFIQRADTLWHAKIKWNNNNNKRKQNVNCKQILQTLKLSNIEGFFYWRRIEGRGKYGKQILD